MQILFVALTALFIVVSVALVLIILVQRPQGGGLTGAFGGGGGTDTAFGGRTGDALTVATISAFAIYLLLAIGLNITGNVMRNAPAVTPASTETPADGTVPTDGAAPATAPTDPTATAPAPTDAPASAPAQGTEEPPRRGAPTELPPGVTPLPSGLPSATDPNAPAPAPAPAAPASGG